MKRVFRPGITLSVILAGFFYAGSVLGSAVLAKPQQGGEAKEFTLSSVSGKTVAMDDFNGRETILFFFTTWCPYCRDKFPLLAREYANYQREGIDLWVVDVAESPAKVSSFLSKQEAPFDVLLDKTGSVAQAYQVVGVPTFVLINKEGRIVYDGNDMPQDYLARLRG